MRKIGLVALLCVVPSTLTAQTQPPTQAPVTPPVPSGPPLASGPPELPREDPGTGLCTPRGQVLGPSDFGVAAGQPLADVSAIRLDDGRVRLYMFAQDVGIVSAVSITSEGLAFAPEAGTRLGPGAGMPRVVRLSDGRWRLFYTSAGGIASAISANGMSFTPEAGARLTAQAAGFGSTLTAATSGATVTTLADGRFRMYFSDLPRPGDPPGNHMVKSAVSADMLTWTVEAGVRLGPGAPVLTDSAEHPFVLANPDGSVTVYHGKFSGPGLGKAEGLYQSTSLDGLTFAQEALGVFFGNDPDALRSTDGTVLVYYGQFDERVGGTINVAQCPDPTSAVAAALRLGAHLTH